MRNKGSAKKPLKWALLFIGIGALLELLFEATSSHPPILPAMLFVVASLIAAILILVGVEIGVFATTQKAGILCLLWILSHWPNRNSLPRVWS